MEKDIFDKIDRLADTVDGEIDKMHKAGIFNKIEAEMNKIAAQLPEKYSISLHFLLDVYDPNRDKSLPIYDSGLAVYGKKTVYRVEVSGATSHTYVVNGKMCRTSQDYCPSCWGYWDGKLSNPVCPSCGITMGKEIKLVLDTDTCPFCERGSITRAEPKCRECGFEVDGQKVYWG